MSYADKIYKRKGKQQQLGSMTIWKLLWWCVSNQEHHGNAHYFFVGVHEGVGIIIVQLVGHRI